ncbi:MAG TPA: oxidoreductase [Gammaproteobacteria bacterium]|jgi:hypothetical protein|nr:oxidoreductase [Gammaproteobacteria bacterium]
MVEEALPKLITLSEYGGDPLPYIEAIYQSYLNNVVNAELHYNKLPVKFQFRPLREGKGFAFWHTISEGEKEEDRTIDLRRCERIRWIAWVIKNASISAKITIWENKRGENEHTVLFFEAESYVVILAKRNGYYLFRTAYSATQRTAHKGKTEISKYHKKLKAPKGAFGCSFYAWQMSTVIL